MDMPVYESPDDDETRQSYNVAPGYTELVYRADVPDWGAGTRRHAGGRPAEEQEDQEDQNGPSQEQGGEQETRYKLQAMRWGKSASCNAHEGVANACLHRTDSVLDEAKTRLRVLDENDQLSR